MIGTSKNGVGDKNQNMMRGCMAVTIVGLLFIGIGVHFNQAWIILPGMGWVVWSGLGFFDYREAWRARMMALAAMTMAERDRFTR